jgi:hypothetical protein
MERLLEGSLTFIKRQLLAAAGKYTDLCSYSIKIELRITRHEGSFRDLMTYA